MSAVYFHLSAVGSQGFPLGHVSNYSYDFEEPLLYGLIFLVFWFNGAGPLSIDSIIYRSIAPEDDSSAGTSSADDQWAIGWTSEVSEWVIEWVNGHRSFSNVVSRIETRHKERIEWVSES